MNDMTKKEKQEQETSILPLLEVNNLHVRFRTRKGTVYAVNGLTYTLGKGETLAIVGESGSGKSVGVLSLIRLIPMPPGEITQGEVIYEGCDLVQISNDQMRRLRGKEISIIFQDPMTSLNPLVPIGDQIAESLKLHLKMDEKMAHEGAVKLLRLVGIPSAADRYESYPHEFSGGMRQRVMIAIALSCNPKLLIADEPTTALDVTIQAQITKLVKELSEKLGMAVIWITHDLGVVAGLADRVAVMYAGRIVEEAPVNEIYDNPRHPYTIGLLNSIPSLTGDPGERLASIKGLPPNLSSLPISCPFYARCGSRIDYCAEHIPPAIPVTAGHLVACWVNGAQELRVEAGLLEQEGECSE